MPRRSSGFAILEPVAPYPAIRFQKGSDKTLVVGDLHLGWEASLKAQGVHIPSQTPRLFENLKHIIEVVDATRLVILGDVKHTIARMELEDWYDIPVFFEALLAIVEDICIIPGNHDGNLEALLPEGIKTLPVSGCTFNDEVGAFHGHAWPSPEILGCKDILMGHLHPIITLIDALGFVTTHQVWLRSQADGDTLARGLLKHLRIHIEDDVKSAMKKRFNVTLANPRCTFIPPFNHLVGGQTINRNLKRQPRGPYLGPLLKCGGIDLKNSDVYLLDGSYLGKVSLLSRVS